LTPSLALTVSLLLLAAPGCSSDAPPPTKLAETVAWRPLGTWSGQGNSQTESFVSDTGTLRVRWETRKAGGKGRGSFRLTVHSGVSGRVIDVAADERGGDGSGESFVRDDTRM
jgi:hypothetical protein